MSQDIINSNQNISYTNLDFSSVYTEVVNLIKQLSYRWDPSIANESDPGVILVKLSALIADKCNYNIDKSILEAFPLSVTQDDNARQLYEQLGYYMHWYQSASVPVALTWIGEKTEEEITYSIPKFTPITDSEGSIIYSIVGVEGVNGTIISSIPFGTNGETVLAVAMEGTPTQLQYQGESVITAQMVDPYTRRLYFSTSYVSDNGVFIKNTNQDNYADWKRVDNLYEQDYNELRYLFGYDSSSDKCYIEFPDNYSELFGSGIEVTYLIINPESANVPAQTLVSLVSPLTLTINSTSTITLDSSNLKIINYDSANGHSDKENINDAYINYKKTVGTFKTLITLRDYLNFIRSDSTLCSNAFVCDRTNDVQCSYKIMSRQKDLDTLLVKVEERINRSSIEASYTLKFKKSTDKGVVSSKTYYALGDDDQMVKVESPTGNPSENGWYELETKNPSDALSPFSLKFYLLNTALSLDTQTAYDETFNMIYTPTDMDSMLDETAHLEHTYEDILPIGENIYRSCYGGTETEDLDWDSTTSYYKIDSESGQMTIISNTSEYGTLKPKDIVGIYRISVETLLPHICMFKQVYPLTINISTYDVLSEDAQNELKKNIVNALYNSTNSNQLEFGEAISLDYLNQVVKNSDDRIKSINFDTFDYTTKAVYYNSYDKSFKEVTLDTYMDITTDVNYRSQDSVFNQLFKKDILCKSILAGTTQLLVPDDTFTYHLYQDYIQYVDNVSNITTETTIDIKNQSITSYSVDVKNPFIKKSYTLKENEILALYRPALTNTKQFLNGVHYEYVLNSDVEANTSHELADNEYFIFYTSITDDSNAIIGYSAYACSKGIIIKPTFNLNAQTSISALTNYATSQLIPELSESNTYWYESATYNETYKTEIRGSNNIANNLISGTSSISIQGVSNVTFEVNDKYKYYWVLNNPDYTSGIKSYVLFPEYSSEDSENSVNTYTLKTGEYLYYTDAEEKNLAIMPPGTTITRNCGVDPTQVTNKPAYGNLYFWKYSVLPTEMPKDSVFNFITDSNNNIIPKSNGFYEVVANPQPISNPTGNPQEQSWYELNSTGDYILTNDTTVNASKVATHKAYFTYDIFKRTDDENIVENKKYYLALMHLTENYYDDETNIKVDTSLRTTFKELDIYDTNYDKGELPIPYEKGWYEVITNSNGYELNDTYSLNINTEDKSNIEPVTSQKRYAKASKYSDVKNTIKESIVTRKILQNTIYASYDISDLSTYRELDMNSISGTSVSSLKLKKPIYEDYYTKSGTVYTPVPTSEIDYLSNPALNGWWKNVDTTPIQADETSPNIIGLEDSSSVDILQELNNVWFNTNTSNKGYLIKPNSNSEIYYYYNRSRLGLGASSPVDATVYTPSPWESYYNIYKTNCNINEWSDADSTKWLSSMPWSTTISYAKPNEYAVRVLVKDGEWDHEPTATKYANKYIKIKVTDIISKSVQQLGNLFPYIPDKFNKSYAYEIGDMCTKYSDDETPVVTWYIATKKVPINKDWDDNDWTQVTDLINLEKYYMVPAGNYKSVFGIIPTESQPLTYYRLEKSGDKEVFTTIDRDFKIELVFPHIYNSNSNSYLNEYGDIQLEYMPKVFKFRDLCAFTYKKYYTLNSYHFRIFETIPAWSCPALDKDTIADSPISTLKTYWQSIQNNTSVEIVENELWSFSEGDIITFQATQTSESAIAWPIFSNEETILDLSQYTISYQRAGDTKQSLDSLEVGDYSWRGYSCLLLNTASGNGQKLAENHKLTLYNNNGEVIAVIPDGAQTDVVVQLKYPMSNKSGSFINVSTLDTLGNVVYNSVYAFKTFSNGDDYKYVIDGNVYSTYLYFNTKTSGSQVIPKQITIPIGLPIGNYLIPITTHSPIEMTATLDQLLENGDSIPQSILKDIDGNLNQLKSYIDDSTTFNKDKLEFIDLPLNEIYVRIKAPSVVTSGLGGSPSTLGWYEKTNDGYAKSTNTTIGQGLISQVVEPSATINPNANGWYVRTGSGTTEDPYVYHITTHTTVQTGTTYYAEKELYVMYEDIDEQNITFAISGTNDEITYIINDVFKYENNSLLGNGFDLIRNKIRRLDSKGEYNYTFKPNSSDLIKNPLLPSSFWSTNHIYNKYSIPKLNFGEDTLQYKFITTKK